MRNVRDLSFSVRVMNVCQNENIILVGDLVQLTDEQLKRYPNMGRTSIQEIQSKLAKIGLSLGMAVPNWPYEDDENEQSIGKESHWFDARKQPPIDIWAEGPWSDEIPLYPLLFKKLNDCDLSVRSSNCFARSGVIYIGDLVQFADVGLMRLPNFGRTSLMEISELLSTEGLALGTDIPIWNEIDKDHFHQLSRRFIDLDLAANLDGVVSVNKNSLPKQTLEEAIEEYKSRGLFTRVELLGFSVRSNGVLKRLGIEYVGDLVLLYPATLLRLQNFGRRSLNEIETALSIRGLELGMRLEYWRPDNIEDIAETCESEIAFNDSESLLESYNASFDQLDERQQYVLRSRLGQDGKKRTLEEVAEEFGITRERVRQIEKKIISRLLSNEFWDDILRLRLGQLRNTVEEPLYLETIGLMDPWFAGFEDNLLLLQSLLDRFSEEMPVYFFPVLGRTLISTIDEGKWQQILSDLRNLLDENVQYNIGFEDVESHIKDKANMEGVPELSGAIFETLYSDLHFSDINGEASLVGVGNALASQLRAILEVSERPMHYSEIAKAYEAEFGVEIKVRNVHARLAYNDFLLFDRGTFGLPKHCWIDAVDRHEIIEVIEEHVELGDASRQWHVREFKELLANKRSDLILDRYILNIILKDSMNLVYLGKSIWVLKDDNAISQVRLQVRDIAYEAIKSNGSPLGVEDIQKWALDKRGMGENLQLVPDKRISRISANKWGILERDFGLTLPEQKLLCLSVFDLLMHRETALHKSELTDLPFEVIATRNPTEDQILGILMADSRFHIWKGGFLGLANWAQHGRKSAAVFFKELNIRMPGTYTTVELLELARLELGYEVEKNLIPAYLSNGGYHFDQASKRWVIS